MSNVLQQLVIFYKLKCYCYNNYYYYNVVVVVANFAPGMYAMECLGELPDEILEYCESNRILVKSKTTNKMK